MQLLSIICLLATCGSCIAKQFPYNSGVLLSDEQPVCLPSNYWLIRSRLPVKAIKTNYAAFLSTLLSDKRFLKYIYPTGGETVSALYPNQVTVANETVGLQKVSLQHYLKSFDTRIFQIFELVKSIPSVYRTVIPNLWTDELMRQAPTHWMDKLLQSKNLDYNLITGISSNHQIVQDKNRRTVLVPPNYLFRPDYWEKHITTFLGESGLGTEWTTEAILSQKLSQLDRAIPHLDAKVTLFENGVRSALQHYLPVGLITMKALMNCSKQIDSEVSQSLGGPDQITAFLHQNPLTYLIPEENGESLGVFIIVPSIQVETQYDRKRIHSYPVKQTGYFSDSWTQVQPPENVLLIKEKHMIPVTDINQLNCLGRYEGICQVCYPYDLHLHSPRACIHKILNKENPYDACTYVTVPEPQPAILQPNPSQLVIVSPDGGDLITNCTQSSQQLRLSPTNIVDLDHTCRYLVSFPDEDNVPQPFLNNLRVQEHVEVPARPFDLWQHMQTNKEYYTAGFFSVLAVITLTCVRWCCPNIRIPWPQTLNPFRWCRRGQNNNTSGNQTSNTRNLRGQQPLLPTDSIPLRISTVQFLPNQQIAIS